MSDLLNRSLIDLDLTSREKKAVTERLADLLLKDGRIADKKDFLEDVWRRETVSSTDTGIGVAIPHGRSSAVIRTSVAIGRHPDGVVWDDEPVQAVILLAVNDDPEGLRHLALIAEISTMLMDEEFLEVLFKKESAQGLVEEIEKRLEENK